MAALSLRLKLLDNKGVASDIVLRLRQRTNLMKSDPYYLGAIIGRFCWAHRPGSLLSIDGQELPAYSCNNNDNQLHGGLQGIK